MRQNFYIFIVTVTARMLRTNKHMSIHLTWYNNFLFTFYIPHQMVILPVILEVDFIKLAQSLTVFIANSQWNEHNLPYLYRETMSAL